MKALQLWIELWSNIETWKTKSGHTAYYAVAIDTMWMLSRVQFSICHAPLIFYILDGELSRELFNDETAIQDFFSEVYGIERIPWDANNTQLCNLYDTTTKEWIKRGYTAYWPKKECRMWD
jgi:hypothetical protein